MLLTSTRSGRLSSPGVGCKETNMMGDYTEESHAFGCILMCSWSNTLFTEHEVRSSSISWYCIQLCKDSNRTYRQTSNIRGGLVGNKIADHSGIVEASPVSVAPTASSSLLDSDLTPVFNGLCKDNSKTTLETFRIWSALHIWTNSQRHLSLMGQQWVVHCEHFGEYKWLANRTEQDYCFQLKRTKKIIKQKKIE